MAGNKLPKASSTKHSKGVNAAPVATPRQGPRPHTKEWAENVKAEAKGEKPPHTGPITYEVS